MKVIVAGGRDFSDYELVKLILDARKAKITEVVSGACPRRWNKQKRLWVGADYFGELWACENGIPVRLFPADWRPNGKLDRRAGHKRNEQMAQYADALVAFPGGNGTADMINRAVVHGLKRLIIPG